MSSNVRFEPITAPGEMVFPIFSEVSIQDATLEVVIVSKNPSPETTTV